MTQPTQGENIARELVAAICDVYGEFPAAIKPAIAKEAWNWVLACEDAGKHPQDEGQTYLRWLRYATRDKHSMREHKPPQHASSAIRDIVSHAGRARMWARQNKPAALAAKPNKHLLIFRTPTPRDDPEYHEFFRDFHRAAAGELTDDDRKRWGIPV